MQIGKGALRTMLGDRNAIADIVPVDYAVDVLMAVPWHLESIRWASKMFGCPRSISLEDLF